MASLASLPVELMMNIAEKLTTCRDLAAFASSNKGIYHCMNRELYKRELQPRQHQFILSQWPIREEHNAACWAAQFGQVNTLVYAIEAGADITRTNRCEVRRYFYRKAMPTTGDSHPDVDTLKSLCLLCWTLHEQDCLKRRLERHYPLGTGDSYYRWYEWPRLRNSDPVYKILLDTNGRHNYRPDPTLLNSFTIEGYEAYFSHNTTHTPLHLSIMQGNMVLVKLLIGQGADVNTSYNWIPPLLESPIGIWRNHRWKNFYKRRRFGDWTALNLAICFGQESMARLLLEMDASVKFDTFDEARVWGQASPAPIQWGVTALHMAALNGIQSLVKHIIDKGYQSDIDVKDKSGQTPLTYAYAAGHFSDLMPYLIQKGANIDVDLDQGTTMLLEACWHGRFDDAIKLIDLGANVNCMLMPQDGVDNAWLLQRARVTPLHVCCGMKQIDRLDPGNSQMQEVHKNKRLATVKKLIAAGADVQAEDGYEMTPLSLARALGYWDIADALHKAGAEDIATPSLMPIFKLTTDWLFDNAP